MLKNKQAMATVAVKDLGVARKFYENVLGLERAASPQEGVAIYQTGSSTMLVYPSQFAGSNKATAATWTLAMDEIEGVVKALRTKGVAFEHYDFPDSKLVGDVHEMRGSKAAWFKDPDGNILALVAGGG